MQERYNVKSMLYIIYIVTLLVFFKGIMARPEFSPALTLPFLFAFVIFLRLLVGSGAGKKESIIILSACFLLFCVLVQEVITNLRAGVVNEVARIILPFLFSAVAGLIFRKVKKQNRLIVLSYALWYGAIILFFISVLRVAFFSSGGFYGFKYNSLFYPDSNFEGFIATFIFLFALAEECFFKKRIAIISLITVLLSFSRAAWVCSFFGMILLLLSDRRVMYSLALVFPILIISSWQALKAAFIYLAEDGSFATKLEIVSYFFVWLEDYPIKNILFGIGSGNLILDFGRESHNILGIIIELGLIPSAIFISLILYILICRKAKWYVWGGAMLLSSSISLFPIAYMSYIYSIVISYEIADKSNAKAVGES